MPPPKDIINCSVHAKSNLLAMVFWQRLTRQYATLRPSTRVPNVQGREIVLVVDELPTLVDEWAISANPQAIDGTTSTPISATGKGHVLSSAALADGDRTDHRIKLTGEEDSQIVSTPMKESPASV